MVRENFDPTSGWIRRLLAALLGVALARLVALGAFVGPITPVIEHGRPVLNWSNSAGEVFIVESAEKLFGANWQKKAVVTTEASVVAWADDDPAVRERYYRVALATNPAPFRTLQQALRRACANQGITGASAAVLLPREGLWIGTYGSSDGVKPIRPQTPFEVGSVTKTLVSATVLRLAEEGKLDLDDTVGRWLPNLNLPNVSPGITIRQLLNHRAGTYNFGDDPDFRRDLFSDWSRRWQPEQVLQYVKAAYFPPDTDGQYSNTGYVLLGLIIRAATGSSVAHQMRQAVLDRAGLHSTFMGAEETWIGKLANPHLDFNGDGIHEDLGGRSQTAILTSFWTSGAEISTAPDLARFGCSLFDGTLLNENSLTAMRNFQSIDAGGTRLDYGLGVMRFEILGREHWAHSGGLFGEYGWFSYCPSTGVSLGVAYNYPVLKAGTNLPGELLLALSTLADATPGLGQSAQAADVPLTAPALIRIPFLDVAVPLVLP